MRRYRAAPVPFRATTPTGKVIGRPAHMSSSAVKAADPRRAGVDWAVYETHSIGDHGEVWEHRRCLDCGRRSVTTLAAAPCPGDEL